MTHQELIDLEAYSIRSFVQEAANSGFLDGAVLDFGCGKQPYREIIEAKGSSYDGYDDTRFLGSVVRKDVGDWGWARPFDSILCTQVIQYVRDPAAFLVDFQHRNVIAPDGYLVMTYPTNWPVIRDELWRFTSFGMEELLKKAGYEIIHHEIRAEIEETGFTLPLGYGVVARAA